MKFGAYYRFLLYSLIFLCLSLALGLSQKDEHSDHDMDERQFLVGLEEKSTDDDFKACKNWIELHGGTITLSMNEDYGRLMVVKMNNHIYELKTAFPDMIESIEEDSGVLDDHDEL